METEGNTHFTFQHKIFAVQRSYFENSAAAEPCFHVPLAETRAVIPITALRKEFGVGEDSDDGLLLTRIPPPHAMC